MTKKKKKYIPTIKVPSDDLMIVDEEDVEHHPHGDEWVKFRKGVPMATMRLAMNAAEVQEKDDVTAGEYLELSAGIIKALSRQIVDWNWTDENYDLLPKPVNDKAAFTEALWNLEDYEIGWLLEHLSDGANVSKN